MNTEKYFAVWLLNVLTTLLCKTSHAGLFLRESGPEIYGTERILTAQYGVNNLYCPQSPSQKDIGVTLV